MCNVCTERGRRLSKSGFQVTHHMTQLIPMCSQAEFKALVRVVGLWLISNTK